MNIIKLSGLIAVVALGAACGEAIDINRVGPNVVAKTALQGEWYYRATIVDKQFGTYDAFIGFEGGLERLKWEVTESQLIGYRSYERVPGTDPSNPGEQNVVVQFPILSHFDIRRQYNPTNGAESNVIEENQIDRPWFEREFMRVGWNSNNAKALDLGTVGPSGGSFVDGVNRNSNETPNNPWKVRISDDYIETTIDGWKAADPYVCYFLDGLSPCNGASVKTKLSFKRVPQDNDYQALDYPDFVERTSGGLVTAATNEPIFTSTSQDFLANGGPFQRICSPAEMDRDGTATVKVVFDPALGGDPRMCNTDPNLGDGDGCVDLVARCDIEGQNNLLGITPNGSDVCDLTRMSPDDCIELTTTVFGRFGYFRTDRFQIDRENGSQYNARERLINRHNIWARSLGADGKVLPFAQRPVKPINYILNVGFPTDLLQVATVDLADDWNVAFMDAVAVARGVKITELPANLNAGFEGAADVSRMFNIKVNDCNIANANKFAEEHDMEADLAANGIAAIAFGNLEESCAVLEFASRERQAKGEDIPVFTWQQLGDLRFNFLNWTSKAELAGPLGYGPSAADPLTGEIISANANMYGASLDTYANWGADIVQLLNGEVSQGDIINGTLAREHVEGVRARWSKKMPAAKLNSFLKVFDHRAGAMSDEQYYVSLPLTALNRGLDKLRDSGVEEEFLLTSETLRLFGNDPVATREGRVTERMRENARPSNWAREHVPAQMLVAANATNPREILGEAFTPSAGRVSAAGRVDELADYLGRKNFCFLGTQIEPAIADLAAKLADDQLDREGVVQFIRRQVFRGVTAHELGHTFGLRHNFEGSADAMNYFPQYWGVGAEGLAEHQQHLLAKSDRPSEIQYSSVMDYHQRFNSDFAGVGLYDKAAIKLGYAETVEVFDESEGDFVGRDWLGNTFLLDPQDFPKLVGGPNADQQIDTLFDDAYEAASLGDESATLDIAGTATIPARPENLFKRANIPLKDWYRTEMLRGFVGGLSDDDCPDFNLPRSVGCMEFFLGANGLNDDDGHRAKVTVPYSFCSDEFAFGGNLTCNRYDLGPTSTEIVKNAGEMYEFYYPFDAFRRDRVQNPFTSWAGGYTDRLYSRTYQPMLNAYRYFYFYRRAQTLRVYPTIRDWGSAALTGMDFFVRVLQQPEPGTYCRDPGAGAGTEDDSYVPASEAADCTDNVEIGLNQGRLYNSRWDSEYDFRPLNLGNYWDKALALQAITSSDAFFFRDFSQETNRGAFSIGYYRIFQNEMLDLFGAVMRNDTSVFAPRISDTDGDGEVEVLYQPFLKTGIYGEPLDIDAAVGDAIRPATSYQLRSYAAIFGMVNMTSTLDQTLDFAQRARITLAGQAGDPSINLDRDGDGVDDLEVVEFTDPQTQLVYRSAATDDVEHSVGFILVNEAKTFADNEWTVSKTALDTAIAGGDDAAITAARTDFARTSNKLNEKIQIIDFMVLLTGAFEFPGG
ncbi:MAG: zinc-dependent metalloprotease [Deltaproteobacteria bacterium]|nr:zinc-dependent metalloprotease [Deltaproteobacteria bacterium]